MNLNRLLIVCSLALSAWSNPTYGVVIDFEQFDVGDDLATVNAALSPLGITFDATFPLTFEVVLDPGDAGNKVIRAKPFGAAGAVDFVANFSSLVETVSVEFVTNPDPVSVISLGSYNANQVASALDPTDFLFGTSLFLSSGTLQLNWPGPPPSPILAATMGVASDGAPSFNYIDNLTVTFAAVAIPEPDSVMLLICSIPLGALLVRRRRQIEQR